MQSEMFTEQEEGNCAPKWEGLEPQGVRERPAD